MALKGIRVLEFAGLAPSPFCGKILADFGANVIRIDRIPQNYLDPLQHGKRTLALNLKHAKAQHLVKQMSNSSDVLIEPFRPGVMERLNLGPEELCASNKRLIYARLTGFGQSGRLAHRAGHDINYAAISGVLSMLGNRGERPQPPLNILADFAGGGLMCAMGILIALLHRHNTGLGQIVDAAMVDGSAYVSSWLFMSRNLPHLWHGARGHNLLDGGFYFYDTYETKDGKYMSVGALEPEFFNIFKEKLGLPELTQSAENDKQQQNAKDLVKKTFMQKTQAEWSRIFENCDACVYPILDWQQVMEHDHNAERQLLQKVDDDSWVPTPAPRLSATPGKVATHKKGLGAREEALSILQEFDISELCVTDMELDGLIILPEPTANL